LELKEYSLLRQNIVESFWGCDVPKEWAPSKFPPKVISNETLPNFIKRKHPRKVLYPIAYYGNGPPLPRNVLSNNIP
jgi:hypothetical protein